MRYRNKHLTTMLVEAEELPNEMWRLTDSENNTRRYLTDEEFAANYTLADEDDIAEGG